MKEKTKVMLIGRKIAALQVDVEIKREIINVVSSSKNSGSCFSKDEVPQEGVKCWVGKELKTLVEVKMTLKVKSVRLAVKREFYEKSCSTNGNVWSGIVAFEDR